MWTGFTTLVRDGEGGVRYETGDEVQRCPESGWRAVRLVSDDPAFRKPDAEARAVTAVPDAQPDTLGDLEFLEHHWGDAYVIGAEGPEYTALNWPGPGQK